MKTQESAKLYKSDGTIIEIAPENGTDFQLKELKDYVGGYIEVVPSVESDYIIVCNEEGKLMGLPMNWEISYLYKGFPQDVIVGDAIYCRSGMIR